MGKGSTLSLVLWTTRAIGTLADEFLELLRRRGETWLPDRFGPDEPLRHRVGGAGDELFRNIWSGKQDASGSAVSLFFRTRTPLAALGSVQWRTAWNQDFNTVSLSVAHTKLEANGGLEALLELGSQIGGLIRAEWGRASLDEEFHSQHFDSRRGTMVGVRLGKAVPGVYYGNYFGPVLSTFIGETRLSDCPAVSRDRLGSGRWLITTAASPMTWDSRAALALKTDVRRHLGERVFFDIRTPDRPTLAPNYDFSEVRVGEPPPAVARPTVSEEMFADAHQARRFLSSISEYCTQFASRVGGQQVLDYSPDSLRVVDALVQRLRRQGVPPDVLRLVLEVAAYYGEVTRRTLGGSWTTDPIDDKMPMVVLKSGEMEFPLIRALKLWEDSDKLFDWFDFIRQGGTSILRGLGPPR